MLVKICSKLGRETKLVRLLSAISCPRFLSRRRVWAFGYCCGILRSCFSRFSRQAIVVVVVVVVVAAIVVVVVVVVVVVGVVDRI